MLVLKFGGTSVGVAEGINNIIKILNDENHKNQVRVVSISALHGVTDALIAAAREASQGGSGYTAELSRMEARHRDLCANFLSGPSLTGITAYCAELFIELARILEGIMILGELTPRIQDLVMSFGERLSAPMITEILNSQGIASEFCDTRGLIRTDKQYGNANYAPIESYAAIRDYLGAHPLLQVATGYIGSDGDGHPTTLGRGGSDLTAAIFAAAIDADGVEIYTDVDGILTADPRYVPNAFLIEKISYEEAMELSHFGAKVLHPPATRPALDRGIPIQIRNTFNASGEGTAITVAAEERSIYPITGISSYGDITLVRLEGSGMVGVAGFSSRLFGSLARRSINVILISQSSSEYSICFAVDIQDGRDARAALEEEFAREISSGVIERPIMEEDLAIIAVVGSQMKSTPGISGKTFHALGRNGVNVVAIAQGSSELNISMVIAKVDVVKALNALHEAFFHSTVRSVNLFLVGIGLIGGTLVEQIAQQREILTERYKIQINILGAANSRLMLFDPQGIPPELIKDILASGNAGLLSSSTSSGVLPYSVGDFIDRMRSFNLPNMAFCDCTASDSTAAAYEAILQNSISIVTPNKRANAGPLSYYRALTEYSRNRGIPYLYETTVCAGLPVISTLRDLALSGDAVRRIEAVLSGTLSYIFNNFDGAKPFSELVREARSRGYTEPDPRDDLNAMDAARKALILARECGMPLEFESVAIEPILPAHCFETPDVEQFFEELKKEDAHFEELRVQAAAKDMVLRYIAVIEGSEARIAIRAEGPESPFRSLVDADNMVVIRTDRYSTLPMIIKGPGAGAQVTAGGVFADILRIARTVI